MFLADLFGKEDQPFAAAHPSPAIPCDRRHVLLFRFAVCALTLDFDLLEYQRHPVTAFRFDREDTGIESC